jgi:quercetin dioxygenase-like cupin family protein
MTAASDPAHEFASVDELAPLALMDGIRVRKVDGERITFGVFELAAGLRMPEHRHPNEQVGVVIRGELRFTIGGETRLRRIGDMWVIPPDVPHTVELVGNAGCTLVESFSPPRADWADKPGEDPSPGVWPPR